MTFVDTGAWFACVVPSDPRHLSVLHWFRVNTGPIITTDHVVDETLTLLRARRERQRALLLGRQFFGLNMVPVHFINEAQWREAWRVFSKHVDRDWSFTDCTSCVVIQQLHIKAAQTFDRHFLEFGVSLALP